MVDGIWALKRTDKRQAKLILAISLKSAKKNCKIVLFTIFIEKNQKCLLKAIFLLFNLEKQCKKLLRKHRTHKVEWQLNILVYKYMCYCASSAKGTSLCFCSVEPMYLIAQG